MNTEAYKQFDLDRLDYINILQEQKIVKDFNSENLCNVYGTSRLDMEYYKGNKYLINEDGIQDIIFELSSLVIVYDNKEVITFISKDGINYRYNYGEPNKVFIRP